jgi:hypothetical protein
LRLAAWSFKGLSTPSQFGLSKIQTAKEIMKVAGTVLGVKDHSLALEDSKSFKLDALQWLALRRQ